MRDVKLRTRHQALEEARVPESLHCVHILTHAVQGSGGRASQNCAHRPHQAGAATPVLVGLGLKADLLKVGKLAKCSEFIGSAQRVAMRTPLPSHLFDPPPSAGMTHRGHLPRPMVGPVGHGTANAARALRLGQSGPTVGSTLLLQKAKGCASSSNTCARQRALSAASWHPWHPDTRIELFPGR